MDTAGFPATIAELQDSYAAGRANPVSVIENARAACEKSQKRLNAFVNLRDTKAEARDCAARIAAGKAASPIDGAPVVVKDFYDTADVPTTAGFQQFARRQPKKDAAMVEKLKAAGAVILGKTNMDTFGQATTGLASDFGAVVNPRWPDHVPGGSSSGSAAAVAAGLAMASIDTDAAGSARLPAACCGIAAFKPTYGLLSGEGILADQPVEPVILALSHVGLQARTAADLALVLEALTGRPAAKPKQLRFAPVANAAVHTAQQASVAAAVGALGRIAEPAAAVETPFHLAVFDHRQIGEHRASSDSLLFKSADVLVLPTLAEPVPTLAAARAAGNTAVRQDNVFFANYFGVPAVSIPIGHDDQGLPISLQLVGRRDADEALLALAAALEALNPIPVAA